MPISIHIEGMDRLLRKMGPELINGPLRDFFKRSAIQVQGEARKRAPVDSGLLRSSINYEVNDRWAKVGTNKHYAPFQEYGTGRMGDPEVAHRGGHWPPGPALDVWASRHGFASGAQVARIIGKRGGLPPKRYLRGALENSLAAIRGFLNQLGADIRARWEQ